MMNDGFRVVKLRISGCWISVIRLKFLILLFPYKPVWRYTVIPIVSFRRNPNFFRGALKGSKLAG
jgi:hypothetical protein